MKKTAKIFLIYFPVILVACQVLVNLLYFIAKPLYLEYGFYLNTFFGTNVLFAVFLLDFTHLFPYCAVSRWAAWAELAFGVNYMIVQTDGLYNIMFQIIVGIVAVSLTFRHYVHKFPLCRFSLVVKFFSKVLASGSCSKGFDEWEQDMRRHVTRKYRQTHANDRA